MLFTNQEKVDRTARRLVKQLEEASITYAVMGGMAVRVHGYVRDTKDVDVLLTGRGVDEFRRHLVPKDYEQLHGRPRRFVDRRSRLVVKCYLTGHRAGIDSTNPFVFPDPRDSRQMIGDVWFVDLPTLIDMKLAAGRYYDLADVVELAKVHALDNDYQAFLQPQLRDRFLRCLAEITADAEFVARNG